MITALGRWARRLEDALPRPADPDISAAELIAEEAEFDGPAQRLDAASEWLEERDPREILEAAESVSPPLRSVAAGPRTTLGEDAIPAWREFSAAPNVGPHARYALYAFDQGPVPGERDLDWLAAESAAAALGGKGPTRRCACSGRGARRRPGRRLAVVHGTGHPAAGNWHAPLPSSPRRAYRAASTREYSSRSR